VLYWLAAWWLHYPWLAEIWLLSLFGEYQFIVAGNSQAVLFTRMLDDNFLLVAKQFCAGDTAFRYVRCVAPFLKFHEFAPL
jgi:hypothetical protein